MSERTLWCGALICALATATPARAQTYDAAAVERLLALEAELDAARTASADATLRAELARRAQIRKPTQIIQVGPIRVLALVEQAALAEEVFGSLWREDFAGVTGSPTLQSSVFVFEWWTTSPSQIGWTLSPAAAGPTIRRVEVPRLYVPTSAGLRSSVRRALWSALREDFPAGSSIRTWLGDNDYAVGPDAYRLLATTPSAANEGCVAGDGAACAAALGLGPMTNLPAWFTPARRRSMVAVAAQPWAERVDPDEPDARACLEERATSACDRVIARLGWVESSTAPASAKAHFLWHAIAAGGEGAWERAIAQGGSSPVDALVVASGQPVERLVDSWQEQLVGARPDVYAGLAGGSAFVAFWTLVLASLAMRSTRWRLA